MNILLIQPPHYFGARSRPPQQFPLGLGYIASALRKKGHHLEVLDIYANQYADKDVGDRVKALSPDIDAVCISALSTQYRYVKWLIKKIKERFDKPVIIGNALATFSSKVLLENSAADICVIGEGEETIVDLMDNLSRPERVKGVSYKSGDKILNTGDRAYIKELDSIDPPARDLFNTQIYLDNCHLWGNPDLKAVNIISARGCPFNCRFCSKTFSGIRLRSVNSVISEIESLRSRYDFKAVSFNDELTIVNDKRTYELCDYFRRSGLKWVCQGRVDKVQPDMLKRMKRSGCVALGFGVESGSQKILDNMNKGIKVEQAIRAVNATKDAGIDPIVQMMCGYEGEDDFAYAETVDFFRKVNMPTMQFSMTTALPGTVLYENSIKRGLIKDEDSYMEKLDWGYYGDREILINFTDYSDDVLSSKRIETENVINKNYREYLSKHPLKTLKVISKKAVSYCRRNGFMKTLAKATNAKSYLKKDSWMV
jgi:radical SAM superfamily enzyme YgiQ (UPF0313 family)